MIEVARKSLQLLELLETIRNVVIDAKIAALVKCAEDLTCEIHEHHIEQ